MQPDKTTQEFINVELAVKKDIESYIAKNTKINTSMELARVHLRNNINWYRIKYKDYNSSDRNKKIVEDIYQKFSDIDKDKLRFYLARFGVFTLFQYIIFYIISSFLLGILLFTQITQITEIKVITFILCNFMGCYITALIYDVSSVIKFYYTRKLK